MKISINTLKLAGLLALLIFTFSSCNKDDCCKPKPKCEDFPQREGDGGIEGGVFQNPNQRRAPCFNPNNPDEFVYLKIEDNLQSLVKCNLETGVEETLLESTKIIGQPDWGENNKIVFSEQYQIRLIDLNLPTDKISLTSENAHLYPKWQNDSILVAEFTFNLARPYFLFILNSNTLSYDTIRNKAFTLGTISQFEDLAYLAYRDDPNITVSRGITSEILTNYKFDGANRIEGLDWISNDKLIYSTARTGIYIITISNKKETCIKNACDTKSYRYLSVSPDGKKILAERVDATDYSTVDGSWTQESKIVIMDIDGNDEKVLFE